MKVIVALDEQMGMLFNHRRQSQDEALREEIIAMTKESVLWVNAYTAKQFPEPKEQMRISEEPMQEAGEGEYCFVEDQEVAGYADRIEELIIFKWNRRYPVDRKFTLSLDGWRLVQTYDFPGKSHEKITKEVWVKGEAE